LNYRRLENGCIGIIDFRTKEEEEGEHSRSVGEEKSLFFLVPKYNEKNNKEKKIIINNIQNNMF